MEKALLKVSNLKTYFYTGDGIIPAVDDVSFEIDKGETLGIVGESGSGKSVTANSIMRLIQSPPGKIVSGRVIFDGEDILKMKKSKLINIRGSKISMIFQDPMTSLNPLFTVGDQIAEAIIIHQKVNKREARHRTLEMLKLVGIPSPEKRIDEYPHKMSGGMRQRVMIAMALSCRPQLLIADEPTTALDVTIQAQILDLINDMKEKLNMAVMIITHDLGVIAKVADRVAVMYAGKIMEYGDAYDVLKRPMHPYTRGLLSSVPTLDDNGGRLKSIDGYLPNLSIDFKGCRFADRCPISEKKCCEIDPELKTIDKRSIRCHKYGGQ